jgi:hypothetical protein
MVVLSTVLGAAALARDDSQAVLLIEALMCSCEFNSN